jgi:NADH-quinone oxidoreductase subunit G
LIDIQIDKIHYAVPRGITILDACRQVGVYVPSLCHHPWIPAAGHCGLCIVKLNGSSFVYACRAKAIAGSSISTKSREGFSLAKMEYDQLFNQVHPPNSPDIESIISFFLPERPKIIRPAESTHSITFSPDQCVKCLRCNRMCADGLDIGAFDDPTLILSKGPCVSCGQCTLTCPTHALAETSHIPRDTGVLRPAK